jgi:hypothetical protein
MGTVLVITSGKGGVGKTTSTAALGAALAQGGQNVVTRLSGRLLRPMPRHRLVHWSSCRMVRSVPLRAHRSSK